MPIYEPSLWLSNDDREILAILAQIVITQTDDECSNLDPSHVTLSPSEASRLLLLLEEFLGSKLFVEGAYFVENLANGEGWSDDRVREIYLSWRKRRGQSRMMSGRRWNEFTIRSGFSASQNAVMFTSVQRNPLRPMTLAHFVAMEKKLVSAAELNPRVRDLIIRFVEMQLKQVEDLQNRKIKIKQGAIRRFVSSFRTDIALIQKGRETIPISRQRAIALSTIIADMSALFVTRDWTAAGVISTVASMAPDAFEAR